jgi:hypothetical protein
MDERERNIVDISLIFPVKHSMGTDSVNIVKDTCN